MAPKIINPLFMFSKLLKIKTIKISNLRLNNWGKVNAISGFSNPFLYIILAFQLFISGHLFALWLGIQRYQDSLSYKLIYLCTCIVNITNISKNILRNVKMCNSKV